MNSSGIRRGLAVAATSALAVAGLALSPASAQTIDVTQNGSGATLYTPSIGNYSTKVDGNGNTTVTLLATAGKSIPAVAGQTVNTIWFHAGTNVAEDNLLSQHVPVQAGLATYQWAAPANVGALTVHAQAEAAGNLPLGAEDTQAVSTTNPNAKQSISIAGANRDKLGLYYDGAVWNGAVTGKTGAAIGATDVKVAGPGTASNANETQTSGADSNGLIGYLGTFTVNPDNLHSVSSADNGTPTDDLVITAANGDDSDGRVFSAYHQVLTQSNVTATVRAGSHQNVAGNVADSYNYCYPGTAPQYNDNCTFWNIKVVDQFGAPVVGVPVYEANAAGAPLGSIFNPPFFGGVGNIVTNFTTGAGTASTGVTQADGVVQTRIDETTMDTVQDQDPASGVQATYYVVDVNNDGDFDNGTDYIVKVTQSNLPQAPASIDLTSAKGLFMDDDETSALKATVKDANGDPVSNVAVTINAHTENITDNTTSDFVVGFGNTDANGELTGVTFNCTAFPNKHTITTLKTTTNNGTSNTTKIECDQALIDWTPNNYQALNGTSVTSKAKLRLPGGQALPGRTVGLTYFPSGNSHFDTTAGSQPAGTVVGTGTSGTATTQADGTFSVKVVDPATPNGQELDSKILADSPGLSVGEANKVYPAPVGVQVAVSDVADVDFLRSVTPTLVTIHNSAAGTSDADGLTPTVPGALRPGSLGVGNVQAFNSDGVALVNTSVDLTITEGNFVNPASPFEPTPVPGAPLDFASAGKTFTVSTGDSTFGTFYTNIERNTGFDDDGKVADEITAKAGSATDGHDLVWTTIGTPVNPQATNPLTVALSAAQQSTILPKARAGHLQGYDPVHPLAGSGQVVDYDVNTFDQFGNKTSQSIHPTDNTPIAGFSTIAGDLNGDGDTTDPGESAVSGFALSNPAITAFSSGTTNQVINTELTGAYKTVYTDNAATSAFDPANPTVLFTSVPVDIETNTDAINWYELNWDTSTFALTHEGASTVPAGTQVTSILTATDQEGQAISGLPIGFLRTGPSDDGDTDGNASDYTNEDGEAFYDWAGNEPGLADVTAVVYNDQLVRQFTVGPDSITFSGEVKQAINLKLTGSSSGNMDIVKANADSNAGGAMAVVKRGGEIIRQHRLNPDGDWTFRITDHNGPKKVTKYRVVVAETASTRQDSKRIGVK